MELELLKDCQLTDEHRKKVDQAAYQLKAGNQAEESIAYDLNLRNRETNNFKKSNSSKPIWMWRSP